MDSNKQTVKAHHEQRRIVGSLMYFFKKTHPGLCVAISMIRSQVPDRTMKHMQAAERTLRYSKRTHNKGVVLWPLLNRQLSAVVDARCGFDTQRNRKSKTRYMVLYREAVIHTSCTLQKSVALSSTEAESVALSEDGKVIILLLNIFEDLGIVQSTTTVYQNSRGAIAWVNGKNPKHFSRNEHVQLRHNLVSDVVPDKIEYDSSHFNRVCERWIRNQAIRSRCIQANTHCLRHFLGYQ